MKSDFLRVMWRWRLWFKKVPNEGNVGAASTEVPIQDNGSGDQGTLPEKGSLFWNKWRCMVLPNPSSRSPSFWRERKLLCWLQALTDVLPDVGSRQLPGAQKVRGPRRGKTWSAIDARVVAQDERSSATDCGNEEQVIVATGDGGAQVDAGADEGSCGL